MLKRNKHRGNKIRLASWLLWHGLAISAFSQTVDPKFTHLTTNEGLSQNSVFSIVKDYKGFMWFGTGEGLNRYDGYKFIVYKHDPAQAGSITDNSVYNVMEDDAHNLWVLTSAGLDRFDQLKESFVHYESGSTNILFRSIFQDSKKRIWLTSSHGFCQVDPADGRFTFYKNNPEDSNSLSQDFVYNMVEDDYGELWIGTRKGLNRFNPETGKFVHYFHDSANKKSMAAGYIKAVYKDHNGSIWAATEGSGIVLFNRTDNSFINFRHDPRNKYSIAHNDVLSFAEDRTGRLWIGTENGGISVFDSAKQSFTSYSKNDNNVSSLSSNSVYSLYMDNIGNMWAGTWSGGINFLPASGDKFSLYRNMPNNDNSLSNNLVLSINNGSDKNVWIGTDGGGLNRFDPVTHDFVHYRTSTNRVNSISTDYVLSIADYRPGILALGHHHGGMDLFDIKKQSFTRFPLKNLNANKLNPPSINIVYPDNDGKLWIGTSDNGGLYSFEPFQRKLTNFFADTKDNSQAGDSSVFVMYETREGEVWLGGDKGLRVLNRKTRVFTYYQQDPRNKNSLSNNTIYALREDNAGNLWVGTAGGLNCFDKKTKTFTVFTEKDGLPNNTIWSIQLDRHGALWLGTNNGLSRFNPFRRTFRNYTTSDGLQDNAFKARASYQSPNGEMFFGGVNGFNTFFPDSIRDNPFIPPVFFTDFQVFNKSLAIGPNSPLKQSINETCEIVLSYAQSVFTIEFAALNFTRSEQNLYAYKLEGFDNDWVYAGKKRTATYTNLDPGTYTFKVKASNNDAVWNQTGASLTIIITPPFWRTWWFVLIVSLAVIGSAIAYYRFRIATIKNQKILLEKKVREQTAMLLHANEEEHKARLEADRANEDLANKNIELEQFVYMASHDLKEPLRTTSNFVDLLEKQYKGRFDEKADKYLYFISQATGRMTVLIKDLLDYSLIEVKKELESVDCNEVVAAVVADLGTAITESGATIEVDALPVVQAYPGNIKQLFQNLIANAIKFRARDVAPHIAIAAQVDGKFWQFSVKDNGIGIEPQNLEKIFLMFQRLHDRTAYEGSGIGLAHCRKIVEVYGGRIWVQSTPGQGTIFNFTIPIQESAAEAKPLTR